MSTTANLGGRLAGAVGTKDVAYSPEELARYAIDGLAPAVIVRPANAAEAAEVVKFAIADKRKVLPMGSRTKCDIGMAPTRYDIALDMTRLHDVVHYDAGDLTLSVDAGMSLREIDGFLKTHRQFLPLAVPCFETTTAGGAIASGIDSVLRHQYGTARDFLIGAEFVDGKGQLCKSGGRVVKNVTGYDLHKLLIGSLGTLAVITRLNFRTFPMPAMTAGHYANFTKSAAALEYQHAVERAGLPLTDFELLSPEIVKMIRAILLQAQEHVPAALVNETWCGYSSYEGSEPVVKRISDELEKHSRTTGARSCGVLAAVDDEPLGGMLREAFEWLRWGSKATLLYRLTACDLGDDLIGALSHAAENLMLRSAVLVRSAGVVYFAAFCDSDADLLAPAGQLQSVVTRVARSKGGDVTLLHAPLEVKMELARACEPRDDQKLQECVKKAFDPSGIFVPGRVAGGI